MAKKLNWGNLPSEVLNIIFLYLKKGDKNVTQEEDLSQCALTYRGWRNASQAVFFSKIILRVKHDINKLFRLLLVNNTLRMLIKTLIFDDTSLDDSTDVTILFALDSQFPNLENLNFFGNDLLYFSLTKMLTENKNFKNLRSLPIPTTIEQDQMYLQCVNFLKERIMTIELFHDNIRNTYSDFHKKLNGFPELEEVIIHTSSRDMNTQDYMRYLEFVVEKLKSLKKLSITTSENENHRFQLLTSVQRNHCSPAELKDIHVIISNDVYALPSEDFMLFMVDKFPKVKSLRLEYGFETFQGVEPPPSPNVATLLPFLKYLSVIPTCFIQNIVLYNGDMIKLIKDLYTVSEEETVSTAFLRHLHVTPRIYDKHDLLEGASPYTSTLSFENVSSRKQKNCIMLNSVSYSQYYNQYHYSDESEESYEDQFQKFIEQVGCFFEMMKIEIPTTSRLDKLLNGVLNHCPRLNELVIHGHKSLSEESFLFEKESEQSCDIKSLTLLGFTPTQKQLIKLFTQLPRLETLVLTNWFLESTSQESFSSINLPNASLKCLEINMDSSFSGLPSHNVYCIKIITDDPKQEAIRFSLIVNCSETSIIIGYSIEENVTESAYQHSIDDPEMSTFLVYCKSLEKLNIRYTEAENNYYHKKVELLPPQHCYSASVQFLQESIFQK